VGSENIVGLDPLLRLAHGNDDTFHVMWNWVGVLEPFININVVFDGSIGDGCVVGSESDGSGDGTFSLWFDSRYCVKSLFLFPSLYSSLSMGSS
jgi:hypothetical protein